MAARILFRTDGGAGIGLGHLQRCLSLATALQRGGAMCLFLLHGDEAALARVAEAGFAARRLESDPRGDEGEVAAEAERLSCDAVVVDSYLTGPDVFDDAGDRYTVAIDDLNAHPIDADLIVSFGPHAPSAGYRAVRDGAQLLLGPAYTILRPEYWDAVLMPPRDAVRNVLVTTGGADPDGRLPRWIAAVDTIDAPFDVTAVVGPFFADPGSVHDAAADARRTVRVVESPKVTRPMQAMADVAVTAAGQTIYELAALGVPAVAVEIASNQRPQLDAFTAMGAMVEATEPTLAATVARLIGSAAERRALSETARGAVDRRGTRTVAAEILAGIGARRKDAS